MLLILNCAPCLSIKPTDDFSTTLDLGGIYKIKILGHYEGGNTDVRLLDCKNIKSNYLVILHEGDNIGKAGLLHPGHIVDCNKCLFRGKFYEDASK